MRDRRARWPAWCLLAVAAWAASATAGDRRDIVFDCPCSAEWTGGEPGEPGTLAVTGGIRSHRAVESGQVVLSARWWTGAGGGSVGRLSERNRMDGHWRMAVAEPDPDAVILVNLLEQTGQDSQESAQWHRHEALALWPVPREGASGPLRFVDILTDTDGDGVGDVNERLAGSSWQDPDSVPGDSVVDILALYTAEFWEAEAGYPYTRILHHLSVVGATFEDNDTNIRLRIVGMSEVEQGEDGWASRESRHELMESHGADMSIQFSRTGGGCTGLGGCAQVGASRSSLWRDAQSFVNVYSTLVTVHELGHAMGLAHSERQGETYGAWRWSRGHHVTPRGVTPRYGTIMAYGRSVLGGVLSNPTTDCGSGPCGVRAEELDGADSATTLDLLRFQVGAHRPPATDTDGDGFVDAADAAPDDPGDWFDIDGDGIADNADLDDDNDGTADVDDAFPLDPTEWADADGDGVGDNADDDVRDLSPFRDPALRAAVEKALDKTAGAPITAEEMASLTELRAQREDIRDLTGLELATGLERLWLDGNRVDDLAPLSGLANLRVLEVASNEVVDLSPLSKLAMLSRIVLSRNRVSDLAPLSSLANLWLLRLDDNPIEDTSALSGLDRMAYLYLNNTRVAVADIFALPYLGRLSGLGLRGLGVDDVSALAAVPRLWSLELDDNAVSDISPLADLVELALLYLGNNRISDLSPLAGLTNLRTLYLEDNAVSDIGALDGLVDLNNLYLSGNRIADLSPLANATSLRLLTVSNNAVGDIGPLAGLVGLSVRQPHCRPFAPRRACRSDLVGAARQPHFRRVAAGGLDLAEGAQPLAQRRFRHRPPRWACQSSRALPGGQPHFRPVAAGGHDIPGRPPSSNERRFRHKPPQRACRSKNPRYRIQPRLRRVAAGGHDRIADTLPPTQRRR